MNPAGFFFSRVDAAGKTIAKLAHRKSALTSNVVEMSLNYRFADFWQQADLSDVDVVISAYDGTELQKLPGHGIILSQSAYCKAQILRWQATSAHQRQQHASNSGTAAGADGQAVGCATRKRTRAASRAADAEDMGSSKPRLVLSLQDAAQLPAALAVLAALYSVKPIPELLSTLPQEQQLHAALLADMWQVADVSTAAVQLLVDAAKPDQGLSAAAYDQFMGLGATPTCLLPLFKVLVELLAQFVDPASQATLKRMLLSVLGDLEDVWADPALRKTLLSMPLTAMTVLLGCNELKVASEDTVLYTAETYVSKLADPQQRRTARQFLAPLVRAPRLSQFWLSAAALSASAAELLLGGYNAQLRQLLMLKAGVGIDSLQGSVLEELVRGAPHSWAHGLRTIRAAPTVEVTWRLDVSTLASTAQSSARQHKALDLFSPSQTPPIGGMVFEIMLSVRWDPGAQGSTVGVYAMPKGVPRDSFYGYSFELGVAGGPCESAVSRVQSRGCGRGWTDFFGTGAMAGGWDAAAWAKKGLPATGELVLTLRVNKVSHVSTNPGGG